MDFRQDKFSLACIEDVKWMFFNQCECYLLPPGMPNANFTKSPLVPPAPPPWTGIAKTMHRKTGGVAKKIVLIFDRLTLGLMTERALICISTLTIISLQSSLWPLYKLWWSEFKKIWGNPGLFFRLFSSFLSILPNKKAQIRTLAAGL